MNVQLQRNTALVTALTTVIFLIITDFADFSGPKYTGYVESPLVYGHQEVSKNNAILTLAFLSSKESKTNTRKYTAI